MALKQLVDAECGGANPLVQWSSHFSENKPAFRSSLGHDRLTELSRTAGAEGQPMSNFMAEQRCLPAVPQTFNMSALLHQLENRSERPHLQEDEAAKARAHGLGQPPAIDPSQLREPLPIPPSRLEESAKGWAYEYGQPSAGPPSQFGQPPTFPASHFGQTPAVRPYLFGEPPPDVPPFEFGQPPPVHPFQFGQHAPVPPSELSEAALAWMHEFGPPPAIDSSQLRDPPSAPSAQLSDAAKAWISECGPPPVVDASQLREPPPVPASQLDEADKVMDHEVRQPSASPLSQKVSEQAHAEKGEQVEEWVKEFQQDNARDGVAAVAREMSANLSGDPQLQGMEFMNFVNKLATGELEVRGNEVVEGEAKWPQNFSDRLENTAPTDTDFWDRLEQEWSALAKGGREEWLADSEQQKKEYHFTENNPLSDSQDPLEEGLKKLQEGDLPSAALLFEVEVQRNPDSVKGWQYLGTTQADNEQEHAAIAASEKCLQLDPGNLKALMTLAVGFTNESQHSKACQTLRKWLQANPKYSSLVPERPNVPEKPFMHSFMSREEHKEVMDLYLAAARLSPTDIDPDVQVGLGVLCNLSNEYDKAVDCFQTALQVRPEDPILWNKLGATLANGNRSEAAIHAYRQALQHVPGFTRCRYNLGISCINLGAHREAVEHFLIALNHQRLAKVPTGARTELSESIWPTLRLALTYLNRLDLLEVRDIDALMKEFDIE